MSDISAQIEAIEHGALVRPMPELGTLLVTGPERQSWIAGMVTAHVSELKPGEGGYALSVSRTGRVLSEL